MILYTVKNGVYYNLEDFKEDLSDLGENGFPNKIYINMTNRCSCSCTFCLRSLKEFNEHNSLWLKEEPSVDLVKELFSKYDWSNVAEIIFCGFGEPTMRFDDVVEVARWLKSIHPDLPLRINTNGLSDLVFGEPTASRLAGIFDTVSISLNAPDAKEYAALTRSRFGIESFQAMLDFATSCLEYVPFVVMSVVAIIGEEKIMKCQAICDDLGVTLRVRPFVE